MKTITIDQSTHTCYSLFQTCAFLLLLAGLKQQPGVSIYFLHFICHFKNMATVSTIRRHSQGLKTNFPINTYLYILFNYCLTENLRPSHTTVKSVNLSTLFLDMLSTSERVHIVSLVHDNFPT